MQYLIDGHNLIPFIPGLSLADLDDETGLIQLLQIHSRVSRNRMEVFFDKAPAGYSGTKKVGMIIVHSISRNTIADQAILARLREMKKAASNWIVVSSDRYVQIESNRLGAKTIGSGEFAKTLQKSLRVEQRQKKEETELSPEEIEEWMKVFGDQNS